MALLSPGPAGTFSGKLGPVEFALTRRGPVAKKAKRQRGMTSRRWFRSRVAWQRRVDAWHALAADVVTQWEAYAASTPYTNRLGVQCYRTAFQCFMIYAFDNTLFPSFPEQNAPPVGATPEPSIFSWSITSGGPYNITLTLTGSVPDGALMRVAVARYIPTGHKFRPRTWTNLFPFPIATGTYDRQYVFTYDNLDFASGEYIALLSNFRLPGRTYTHDYIHYVTVS